MKNLRVVVVGTVCVFLVGAGFLVPLSAAERAEVPEAVSPAPAPGLGQALVEVRCPTFAWTAVEGASGYELVVLAVPEGSVEQAVAEPPVVTRARLSAGARAWVPSLGSCLERGGQYAWSVRASTAAGEGPWSEPALFRVAAGPSVQEVEGAMETLRRFVSAERPERELVADAAAEVDRAAARRERMRQGLGESRDRSGTRGREATASGEQRFPEATELQVAGAQSMQGLALASAPVLDSPSLSVSSDIALGSNSNLFKNGEVFLWDDENSSNIALGRSALSSASGTATGNTAVGREALAATTTGTVSWHGSFNTALGDRALSENTIGDSNTAIGFEALSSNSTGFSNTGTGESALQNNTTGSGNTATGRVALRKNTTGSQNTATGAHALGENTIGQRNTASGYTALLNNSAGSGNTAIGTYAMRINKTGDRNTAVGYDTLKRNNQGHRNVAIGSSAGFNVNGADRDDNIFISNAGEATDNKKIRIGTQGTQNGTFVAGIHGTFVTGGSTVKVDENGQLGVELTVSSSRFKEGIEELGEIGERLAALRPVSFHYRAEVFPDGGPQVGLIAEEVAELFPELVTRDAEGRPFGVRYDLLSVLSIAELQREHQRGLAHERELAALRDRLEAVERGRPVGAVEPLRRWWRRP